jgi:hypothetical protein
LPHHDSVRANTAGTTAIRQSPANLSGIFSIARIETDEMTSPGRCPALVVLADIARSARLERHGQGNPMRLTLYILIAITGLGMGTAYAVDSEAPRPNRPQTVKCTATVNVWVEVDNDSLPERMGAKAESNKRVQLRLVGSSPSRGESVVCSYASRSRDVTTSYYMRCTNPRKERGQRHTYRCQ